LSLLAHAAAPLRPADVRILVRVMGRGGQPPARVAGVAAEAGGTPHTVRVLVGWAREVARRAGSPDSLLAAGRLLRKRVRSGAEAALAVHAAGLTAEVLHPATVELAADWFGLTPAVVVWWLPDGTSLTVPMRQRHQVVAAPGRMRLRCLTRGIVTVEDLVTRTGLPEELVLRLVDVDPRFGRLEDQVWTVPDTGRNVVRLAVRRQLAVRAHTVADLHAGICAALRTRPGVAPPTVQAPRAYLASQGGYRITGERVRAAPHAGAGIAATDAAIVEAFRAGPASELSMRQLRRALVGAGFADSGAPHLVRGSPVLRRVGHGRYTLGGTGRLPGGHPSLRRSA